MRGKALHFVRRNKRILDADGFRDPRRQVQHIAVPQKLLRPVHVQDRARVDLRGHLIRQTGREIRLDHTCDDVHRRPLRRQDKVDAHRPGKLSEPGDRFFHFPRRGHHEVSQFINDDNDEGHLPVFDVVCVPQPSLKKSLVVVGDIADAGRGERIVSPLHFELQPLQQ